MLERNKADMKKIYIAFIVCLSILLLINTQGDTSAQTSNTPSGLPSSFYGTVQLDGQNVPVGTEISAWVDAVKVSQTNVILFDDMSVYALDVALAFNPQNATIIFRIGDNQSDINGYFAGGSNINLNLSANSEPSQNSIYLPLIIKN